MNEAYSYNLQDDCGAGEVAGVSACGSKAAGSNDAAGMVAPAVSGSINERQQAAVAVAVMSLWHGVTAGLQGMLRRCTSQEDNTKHDVDSASD